MNLSIYRIFKGETITVTGTFQCTQAEMYKLLEKHGAKKGKLYYSSQLLTRVLSLQKGWTYKKVSTVLGVIIVGD
jgi:hypothetical protein